MLIFALHCAGKSAGVAVLKDDTIIYESYLNTGFTHSEKLLPLCTAAFDACGITAKDVDLFAPTAGPGSFTGLRIGLATVKGLALPFGTPVAPVSTLEAAAAAFEQDGTVIAALDARRSEVYFAAFEREGGVLRRLTKDAAAPASELCQLVENCKKPLFFVGDGAELCYTIFEENEGVHRTAEITPHLGAGAALAAKRMYLAGETCTPAQARASYLRLSQAERERAQRQAAQNETEAI